MQREIVRSDDVIGVAVENAQGEDLGKVEGLMLDKLEGRVRYVVLSFGGILGIGDKLFALPWHIFSYKPDRQKYVIDIDKDTLKNSPGFDKNAWPLNSDSSKLYESVDKYYNDYL